MKSTEFEGIFSFERIKMKKSFPMKTKENEIKNKKKL